MRVLRGLVCSAVLTAITCGPAGALEIVVYPASSFSLSASADSTSRMEVFGEVGFDVYLIPVSDGEFFSGRTGVADEDRYSNIDTDGLLAFIESHTDLASLASNLVVLPESSEERAALEAIFSDLGDLFSATSWTAPTRSLWLVAPADLSPIPEPTTMLLLGSGLAGLAGYARRRKR